jgi:branched-chain amino acid transport system ATP-binding protein
MESETGGLRITDLTVRYGGVVANQNVTLEVRPGEIVGLIGPNGAGKTTLVDAATGFARYEGSVALDGRSLDRLAPHRRRRAGLSRTWQSGELFDNLTVEQNVLSALRPGGLRALGRDVFGRRSSATPPEVMRALEQVGLSDMKDAVARDLSLGRQKLVGVARALVGTCGLLLLDEPAAGLHQHESDEFASSMRAIARGGLGTLLIDHDMQLVLGVCDRLYVMEFGKIIFSGTPAEARVSPAVINAYLGEPLEVGNE